MSVPGLTTMRQLLDTAIGEVEHWQRTSAPPAIPAHRIANLRDKLEALRGAGSVGLLRTGMEHISISVASLEVPVSELAPSLVQLASLLAGRSRPTPGSGSLGNAVRALMLLCLLFGATAASAEPRHFHRRSLLDDVLIPKFEFHEATVMECIDVFRAKALGDYKSSWYEGKFPVELRYTPKKVRNPVSFKLQNVTLRQALEAFCKEANLRLRVEEDRIVLEDAHP